MGSKVALWGTTHQDWLLDALLLLGRRFELAGWRLGLSVAQQRAAIEEQNTHPTISVHTCGA